MENISEMLRASITKAYPQLQNITPDQAAARPAPGKWSPKEIIGHLIDSAANNHQRFVRVQEGATHLQPYRYDQNHWVTSQNYQEAEWEELVQCWYFYNLHLCHVIRQIPESLEEITIYMLPDHPITFGFLVNDYVAHLQHHLKSICDFS